MAGLVLLVFYRYCMRQDIARAQAFTAAHQPAT
jgi:hypothetical protein